MTDVFVPPAHGEWLAANVPGCIVKINDAAGHLGANPEQEIAENARWLSAGIAPDGSHALSRRQLRPLSLHRQARVTLRRAGHEGLEPNHASIKASLEPCLGFTQEPWDDPQEIPTARPHRWPASIRTSPIPKVTHDPNTTLGWCDDQFEFEFAVDLLLDGLERLRDAESNGAKTPS